MDSSKFLGLARCAAPFDGSLPCQGELEQGHASLICRKCSYSYKLNSHFGFPILAPRSDEEMQADRYEDPKNRHAEDYGAIWAFGYYFLQRGEAEGFYRTINELIFTTPLKEDGQHHILEVGCGVGRTVCDVARHYPNAFVVGTDLSQRMLEQAYSMVIGTHPDSSVQVSLEPEGLGVLSARSFGLTNVFLAQASVLALPFASAQFDLVVSSNVIDRVPDPRQMLSEVARVLKPGGYFIFTDPFNWKALPQWWGGCRTLDQFKAVLAEYPLQIDLAFDGLVYREMLDVRGAYTDWPVAVVRAVKMDRMEKDSEEAS